MRRPRILDLFCCAGGAGMGYHQAGFDVVGVDINPQPRYPFEFIQADCICLSAAFLRSFDAVHASPPCQAHSALKSMHNARRHTDLVPATRIMLEDSGLPYVIENVEGAPLNEPIKLCGTMFGLSAGGADIRRHRLFEASFPIVQPSCRHSSRPTIGIYGKGARDSRRKFDKSIPEFTAEQAREAMGIDWMDLKTLSQAIPPAYTRFIGEQLLAHLQASDRIAA
jgi:DNA (cytosine-5)-methyltransferase 1